ncbi:MAG: EAL domain-containing protein [Methylophaga sp.]|nr:EAL domain-containing protein [Methylophaga sp.]
MIVILSVLLVSLISLLTYYQYSKQTLLSSELQELRSQTSATISHYENIVQLASPSLQALSQLLKNELATSNAKKIASFDSQIVQFDDGAWRNIRDNFSGMQQAGIFLPPDIQLTPEIKQFYATALNTFDMFGSSATSHPIFNNIWMLGHDRSEIIFDRGFPDFVYSMEADTDYTTTPWMTLVSPVNNPQRTIKWTPALFDPVSKIWVVSALLPLDVNDEWVATLGIDVSLDVLFSLLSSQGIQYKNEQHFLVDKDGHFILAGPWQKQLQASPEIFHLDNKQHDLIKMVTDKINIKSQTLSLVTIGNMEYRVIANQIQANEWRYFRLIPTAEILKPLNNYLLKATIFILFTIFILGLFINTAVRKMVVNPLLEMVDRAKAYATGQSPPINEIKGTIEIEQLDNALRTMHNTLTVDTLQLLESEQRYRQVVTNINEVVVQIGKNKEWQFLSPVWKELSGFLLEESLYKSVGEFLSPIDSEYVEHVLELLFSGEQDAWEGNVRLKCSDERYIWVQFSLHINKESQQAEQSIYGTIENVHINRITGDINKLIREAEQKVLTSNVTIATLLEFVTEELVYILDISSAWVKICVDNKSQVLSHAGAVSDFLFEGSHTWEGLHSDKGPVIECTHNYIPIRVTKDSELPEEWRQRLQFDEINDSLFLPFYIGGDTKAVLGFHAFESDIFTEDLQSVLRNFTEGLRLICKMLEDQNLMRLHRAAVEKTANAITIIDAHGNIEWVNNAFIKQTLYRSEEVIGQKLTTLEVEGSNNDLWQKVKTGEVWSGELTYRRKDGSTMIVHQTVTPLLDDLSEITHYIAVSEDITERKANHQRIAFMATHDELTSLPNRNLLNDRLQQSIEHAKRQSLKMAVLFIDIDHFKYINDSLGHQIGDELLQILAVRLQSVLRKEDTVARFGGDEFVVVLSNITEVSYVKSIATKLLNKIKSPYKIMEHELLITGSIGISLYPNDAVDSNNLIQQADSAMYLAKEQGRNNSQFYTAEINEKITRRLTLEKALRQAVEQQQFVVFYQPKINLMTNQITGVEALVRWQHPELGLVSPMEFIPLAEETGIILELGRWVMETACKQMKIWEDQYSELVNMSINVSARQFWQDDFVVQVANILSETGVSCDKIEFELTETVVLGDVDSAIFTMLELKNMGISLSIDDFGTGYSSLNYLQQLPVDVLKIDRTFISSLGKGDSDYAVVRSILALADNFKLRVVAEGIETAEQQHILTTLGCHYGQGYYFCVPMNADDLMQHIAAQQESQFTLWSDG